MFSLCFLSDVVRTEPQHFLSPLENTKRTSKQIGSFDEVHELRYRDALMNTLAQKYTSTVISECGLVLTIYKLVEVGFSYIVAGGDGSSWTPVKFLLVTFRPAIGIVLTGLVFRQDSEHGILLTIGFSQHNVTIQVPPRGLQPRSYYDTRRRVYFWKGFLEEEDKLESCSGVDASAGVLVDGHRGAASYQEVPSDVLFYRNEALARVVVTNVRFVPLISCSSLLPQWETSTTQASSHSGTQPMQMPNVSDKSNTSTDTSSAGFDRSAAETLMLIEGRMDADGLGMEVWWS